MTCEIVAEIANAHQGSAKTALRLARAATDAGADAVKFQVYFAEELLVRNHPRFEHFRNQSFAAEEWRSLLAQTTGTGARVYCDVFGMKSLELVASEDVLGLKIHSSDLSNTPLVQAAAGTGKRILVATGGSTSREITSAVRAITAASRLRPVLLHGFQSYPTKVEDACLVRLKWLVGLFGMTCEYGYMDHTDGGDAFSTILPVAALGMGATVIEKHITLDRAAKGTDYYSSFNPDEFSKFVRVIRTVESAIGQAPEKFSLSEKTYRQEVKKYWVASRELKSGDLLSQDDMVMKRVAGVSAKTVEAEKLLGRTVLHDCGIEEVITRATMRQTVWALVVARMKSTRLPGKALVDVAGLPALVHLFERLKQAQRVDKIVLCTTEALEDEQLVNAAKSAGIDSFRGPTEDVLARMLGAIGQDQVDAVLRVTGDDILVDPEYADRAIEHHFWMNAEYSDLKKLPSGTEVEVFDVSLLRDIRKTAKDSGGTEYLTFYITANADQFRTQSVRVEERHALDWRLTLDSPLDYEVIRALLEEMARKGKRTDYRMDDIVEFFTEHPEILEINRPSRMGRTHMTVCTDLDWSKLR